MAFIPTPNTWRAALSFESSGGNHAANVIYVGDPAGVMDGARAQELADIIHDWAVTEWAPVAVNAWTLKSVDVADAGSQTGASAANASPVTGVGNNSMLPAQDTIAVSLRTGAMGRSNRGRLYHVGLGEGDITDGLLNLTTQTALINAYGTLRSNLLVDGFEWVVVSFQTNGTPRVAGASREVTDITITDAKIDRQLRRK